MVNDMNRNEILELVNDKIKSLQTLVDKTHPEDCNLLLCVDAKGNTMKEYVHVEPQFLMQACVRMQTTLWVSIIKDSMDKPASKENSDKLEIHFNILQNNLIKSIQENLGGEGAKIYADLFKKYAKGLESQ